MGYLWERLWVRVLPQRFLTASVGWFAARRISRHLIPWFVNHYRIDVTEAEHPVSAYESWLDFFSRRLQPDTRPLTSVGVASPVDGRASCHGEIREGTLLQAKGSTYTIRALLGSEDLAKAYSGGQYMTLYLSPRDYHRVHMPLDGEVVHWTHIPGTLYPVNPSGVRTIPGLFTKNERLVVEFLTELGPFAMVLVGATIVGSIRTSFGPEYASPFYRGKWGVTNGETSIQLGRGEELGFFAFGSTVILLFPPGWNLRFIIQEDDTVRMGQALAQLVSQSG